LLGARWNRLRKLCLFVDDYRGPLIILAGFFETFYPLWWATCETPPSHSIVSAPNNGLIHHHLQKLKMSYEVLKIACCVLCDCITSINEYPRTSLNSCMSIAIYFRRLRSERVHTSWQYDIWLFTSIKRPRLIFYNGFNRHWTRKRDTKNLIL
jgi:hypothetical protein